ncbi:lung adenoma susceptibility protein 2 isoform X1 [Trachemys scripta elegans]|uniref:lung adenoma susceptibility protein 2 isoform X1 n=1 Tax=Trachemys scripta elegans TaxID=31138 RepID=UPI0015544BC9|nr:lung adenoma susceptibility protein 2 isoform X1 [Trachemys scripta elegans]XP_034629595.1 lung adenoma susceptibility protein 2 isoform X1 [Trachemys scripta elegans]XP_034629596.1 lung adenoma susceptibility protein 2 isoform X1 [Trachemys scripta elegans]
MACSFEKDNIYSPESTVSSLLASCSLNSSNSNGSIQYKDKVYNSASQALEAYIEDFDQSLMSSEVSTGKICIGQSTPKDKSAKFASVQKYALEDFNQQVKLNSIASPFIRQTVCDPDLISLTTDDLLAFPADGSLPFIHKSPSGSGLQSGKWIRKSLKKPAFYPYQTSAFDVEKDFDFQDNGNAVDNRNHYRDVDKEKHNVYKSHKYNSIFSKENAGDCLFQQHSESISVKNYPRWLTSHKSDLNVSGISSIPDFKYPIWLKSHNLLCDSANQSFIQTLNMQDEFSSSQMCESMKKKHIVNKLDCNSFEQNSYLEPTGDSEVTGNCRYVRPSTDFQPGNVLSRQSKQPFRDDQIELLILKAKRTLESSVENLSSALKNDGSPCTVDILEAERSWENVPVAFKPPVPVHCEEDENSLQSPKANIVNEFLEDCLNNDNQENTFSGGNHHGPVEALKLMLFNLQAVHESFNKNKTAEQNDEFKKLSEEAVSELKQCDNVVIPITKSLRRALHHLSRLKGLVDDTSGKQDQKDYHQEDGKGKNLQIRNTLLEAEQSI